MHESKNWLALVRILQINTSCNLWSENCGKGLIISHTCIKSLRYEYAVGWLTGATAEVLLVSFRNDEKVIFYMHVYLFVY